MIAARLIPLYLLGLSGCGAVDDAINGRADERACLKSLSPFSLPGEQPQIVKSSRVDTPISLAQYLERYRIGETNQALLLEAKLASEGGGLSIRDLALTYRLDGVEKTDICQFRLTGGKLDKREFLMMIADRVSSQKELVKMGYAPPDGLPVKECCVW